MEMPAVDRANLVWNDDRLHRSPTIAFRRDRSKIHYSVKQLARRVDHDGPRRRARRSGTLSNPNPYRARQTRGRRVPRAGAPVDRRIADEQRSPRRRTPACATRCSSPAGSGLRGNGPSPPTTASAGKYRARSSPSRIAAWRRAACWSAPPAARARPSSSSTSRNAADRARVLQQPLVVDREKPIEGIGRRCDAAPRTRARPASPRLARPSGRSRSSESGAAPHDSSSALAASAMSRRESTSVPSRSKTNSRNRCDG